MFRIARGYHKKKGYYCEFYFDKEKKTVWILFPYGQGFYEIENGKQFENGEQVKAAIQRLIK